MLRKRLIAAVSVVIVASSLIIGCGSSDTTMSKKGNDTTIAISGSTSVGPLVELEEEEFEANNQGVTIEINQTG